MEFSGFLLLFIVMSRFLVCMIIIHKELYAKKNHSNVSTYSSFYILLLWKIGIQNNCILFAKEPSWRRICLFIWNDFSEIRDNFLLFAVGSLYAQYIAMYRMWKMYRRSKNKLRCLCLVNQLGQQKKKRRKLMLWNWKKKICNDVCMKQRSELIAISFGLYPSNLKWINLSFCRYESIENCMQQPEQIYIDEPRCSLSFVITFGRFCLLKLLSNGNRSFEALKLQNLCC